jgi:hypothetical protein
MPSRKQRRRREKERRHEYEYVYVDEEGHEVPVEGVDAGQDEKPRSSRDGARPETKRARSGSGSAAAGRRGTALREVPPPSWRRVGKRALIFGPFMFLTIALLERGAGIGTQLLITSQMLILFVPFSYVMDRVLYRRYLKQAEAPRTHTRRRGS